MGGMQVHDRLLRASQTSDPQPTFTRFAERKRHLS